jgi:hypothetical protein
MTIRKEKTRYAKEVETGAEGVEGREWNVTRKDELSCWQREGELH